MEEKLLEKLTVLGEGAKYDVSCSSSGAARMNIGRLGNAACAGICHTWTADGRCLSLLKVLLSNDCAYDCKYCVNRRSADGPRRTFEPRELAELTMGFYRRNYIEGLFLSSAVLRSPDNTAERMIECLWLLREAHGFAGYIHAKIIPGVSAELLTQLGLLSDRLSVNVELPSSESLGLLAPQKKPKGIFSPMRQILQAQREQQTLKAAGNRGRLRPAGSSAGVGDGCYDDLRELAGRAGTPEAIDQLMRAGFARGGTSAVQGSAHSGRGLQTAPRGRYRERFAPAGQTTQMIIGASPESDLEIVKLSEALYRRFALKRVYFSAYIPLAAAPELPPLLTPPPLKREHRLYQADFLLRFYGFTADEILTPEQPDLDVDLDPKVCWALRHLELFPIEVNRASEEELLRIPGVGTVSALRILRQRRIASVGYDDLKKMGVVLKRARFFLSCRGKYYGGKEREPVAIREKLLLDERTLRDSLGSGVPPQISLWDTLNGPAVLGTRKEPAVWSAGNELSVRQEL